jgi:cytochrome c
MGGMEFNKIFAAVLVAGIVAMLGGFVAKKLVHPEKLAEPAYNIEVAEVSAGPGAAEPVAEPILAMIATADAARGEKIAKACAACHSFNKGGANGVGPNMWNTVGNKKHHAPGYAYSGALIEVGGDRWTYAELNKFLWKPKAYAKGTKMAYAGLRKPEDRAALLAWMRLQADSPTALPTEAEIAAELAELAPPVPEVAPAADGEAAAPGDAKPADSVPADSVPPATASEKAAP